jgi:hypothetical protein
MKFLTPAVRTYIYGVISAAMPLLVTAGVLSTDATKDWLFLAAALLGLGSNIMAAANVKQPEKIVVESPASIPLFVQK